MANKVVLKKPVRPASHIAPVTAKKNVKGDPVVETYRALAPLRVNDGDGTENTHVRQYGDLVPEAATWKNLWHYLNAKQLEMVYLNQSQITEWEKRFKERCEQEDAEQRALSEQESEELALRARLKELEAAKAKKTAKDRPANSHEVREDTRAEKIDFGGLPKQPGLPQLQELPKVTREVPVQKNVSENRKRSNTSGRTLRKVQ